MTGYEILETIKDTNPGWWAVILLLFLKLVDIVPIKINPWTALWSGLGKLLNRDISSRLESLEDRMDKSEAERGEDKTMAARIRILRFGDEVKLGVRHSEEHFNQVLDDISDYDQYCTKHPEFPNEKTKATRKIILDAYTRCVQQNDFL